MKRIDTSSGAKDCSTCHQNKNLENFRKRTDRISGYQSRCRSCESTQYRQYNQSHRKTRLAWQRSKPAKEKAALWLKTAAGKASLKRRFAKYRQKPGIEAKISVRMKSPKYNAHKGNHWDSTFENESWRIRVKAIQ